MSKVAPTEFANFHPSVYWCVLGMGANWHWDEEQKKLIVKTATFRQSLQLRDFVDYLSPKNSGQVWIIYEQE